MKNLYPMKLTPITKDIIWGGDKLVHEYGVISDNPCVAEAWLLSVRKDGMSIIENGDYRGKTLRKYLNAEGDSAICDGFSLDRFPLLIKFIDAKDDLSIQVHPDNDYAISHENEFGKTEMWYIVEAEPDARIVYGLKPGVTIEDFTYAVQQSDYDSVLNYVDVRAGEVYYIPSGLVHAICHGVLIAEIQQNSNITYRVYDYDRTGADGKPRPLHTKKALDVVRAFTQDEITALRFSRGGCADNSLLAASCFFTVKQLETNKSSISLTAGRESFNSVICTDGKGEIEVCGEKYTIKKGDSYFIPAGMGDYSITSDARASFIVTMMK